MIKLRRRIMVSLASEWPYVDLGLPSGLLWGKGNIGKDSQGKYYMESETGDGAYFSWGNIIGHNNGDGYSFDETNYNSTPGKTLTTSVPINATYDAGMACLGSPWRVPTNDEFQELIDNTDNEWTTINGRRGWKFMNKSDNSIYIFIPAVGNISDTSRSNYNNNCRYWTSIRYSSDNARAFYGVSSSVDIKNYKKLNGYTIRCVRSAI